MDRAWTCEIYDIVCLTNQVSLQIHNSGWWLFEVVAVEYRRSFYFYTMDWLFCRVEQSVAMILS